MQTINRPKLSSDGRGPGQSKDGKGPLSTKGGSVAAALLTAALAAVVIVIFINQYKDSINEESVPTPVLVANEQIALGASADSLGESGAFKATTVPKGELKPGAITDASTLQGKVAARDILPGQQLTTPDFKEAGNGIVTKLDATERAISLPLDRAHGLLGPLKVGDRVDIMSGFVLDSGAGRARPVMRTIAQNVLVLAVPPATKSNGVGSSNRTKEVTVRVASSAAPKIAYASEYGKVWLVLRPENGEDVDKRTIVTLQTMLAREAQTAGNGGGQ